MQIISFIVIYHYHGYDRKQSPAAQRAFTKAKENFRIQARYCWYFVKCKHGRKGKDSERNE